MSIKNDSLTEKAGVKSTGEKKESHIGKKILCVILALLLCVGISFLVANIVHRNSKGDRTDIENGLSAYELAVKNGFDGSVQEWLSSLEGKSAYDIAKDGGYTGTKDEWASALADMASRDAASVKTASFSEKGELLITLSDGTVLNLGKAVGTDGKDGTNGTNGVDGKDGANGINGTDGKDGKDGIDGLNGQDGKNGENGQDGVGITAAQINADGQLVITLSDESVINLDKVVGMNGSDGISVTGSEINSDGELVLTFSNGQRSNLGSIMGAAGKDGQNGADGKDGIDGQDGENGISITASRVNAMGELVLTYSDGTDANLGVIVGAKGADGENGEDGADGIGVTGAEINSEGQLVLTFSNGQRSNLGNVMGAAGKDGIDGANGLNGADGKDGIDGADGISIVKTEINSEGELIITSSDNTVSNLGRVIGADGADGKDGADGADGANGTDGRDGADGVGIRNILINTNGELEITLTSGTVMELGKIVGADGRDGIDGQNGKDGVNGQDGKDGQDGADGTGVSGTSINALGELIISYSDGTSVNLGCVVGADGKDGANGADGQDGKDGKDGADGINGTNGQDGVGVASSEINADGELVIKYTDGTSANLGVIVGANGKDGADGKDGVNGQVGKDGQDGKNGADGIGISDVNINTDGELVLTFSDASSINLGCIVGKDGQDGADGQNGKDGVNGTDGKDGADGVGIANVSVSDDGILTVTLTSGATLNLGNIKGADGIGVSKSEINADGELILTYTNGSSTNLGVVVGANGKDGADGKDGKDGIGISNVTVSAEGALTATLSNGATLNLGNIKGADGIGITKSEINADGELILTYTNGESANIGSVAGAKGADGKDGVGIKSVTLSSAGDLSILMTDNTVYSLGNIKGEKGDKGDTGAQGEKGEKGDPGADGRGIANMEIIDGELVVTYTDGTSDNLGPIGTTVEDSASLLIFEMLSDGTWKVSIKEDAKLSVESITVPSTYNGRIVSTIGSFTGCPYLKNVVLPETVTTISERAFSGAIFTSIDLPEGLETIGDNAFGGVPLTEIVIPDSVTSIGKGAFSCSRSLASIEKVTIGKNVVSIGCEAFCNQVKIETITIPSSVNSMIAPFLGCSNLKTVYFEDPSNWYTSFSSNYVDIYKSAANKSVSELFSDPELAAKELLRSTNNGTRYAWYKK